MTAQKAEHAKNGAIGPPDRNGEMTPDRDHLRDRQIRRDGMLTGVGDQAGQASIQDVFAVNFPQIHALAGTDHCFQTGGAYSMKDGSFLNELGQVGHLHSKRLSYRIQRVLNGGTVFWVGKKGRYRGGLLCHGRPHDPAFRQP